MKDMLGRELTVTVERALQLLMEHISGRVTAEVEMGIEDALGRVCAQDVVAPEDLPGFTRSTVDGFAVHAADTFGAGDAMPAYLQLHDREVRMGEASGFAVPRGRACRIPTGGMLPSGPDAVVMFEHAQSVDGGMIEVLRPVAPGDNVIRPDEDVSRGGQVIRRGRRLGPYDLAACAGIGITVVRCFERPKVSIISTGDEIIPAGMTPSIGQIRDCNSHLLAGMVAEAGGLPIRRGIFRDDYDTLRGVIEQAMADSDVILLSGGTSVGVKDMVARIIGDIGSPGIIFHGVAMKPGKPMISGVVRGIPIFGLPGHPAAVSVCCDVFVRPVLERISGVVGRLPLPAGRWVRAKVAKNVASAAGREDHVRVAIELRDDGVWAVPVLGKSGLISTLVKADGAFVIPLQAAGVEQGETVDVKLF